MKIESWSFIFVEGVAAPFIINIFYFLSNSTAFVPRIRIF